MSEEDGDDVNFASMGFLTTADGEDFESRVKLKKFEVVQLAKWNDLSEKTGSVECCNLFAKMLEMNGFPLFDVEVRDVPGGLNTLIERASQGLRFEFGRDLHQLFENVQKPGVDLWFDDLERRPTNLMPDYYRRQAWYKVIFALHPKQELDDGAIKTWFDVLDRWHPGCMLMIESGLEVIDLPGALTDPNRFYELQMATSWLETRFQARMTVAMQRGEPPDWIFLPFNQGNYHWKLGAMNVRNRTFVLYDSSRSRDRRLQTEDEARHFKVIETLVLPLFCSTKDLKEWRLVHMDAVPQQRDGVSCGLFTCFFALKLISGEMVSSNETVDAERFRVDVVVPTFRELIGGNPPKGEILMRLLKLANRPIERKQ